MKGMICPKCGKKGMRVVDTAQNTKSNETMRRKKCEACGHMIATVEMEVEYNNAFKAEWRKFKQ